MSQWRCDNCGTVFKEIKESNCSNKDDDRRAFEFLSTIAPVKVTKTCYKCMTVTVTTMNNGIESGIERKTPVMEANQRSAEVATTKKDGEPKRGRQQSADYGETDGSHDGVSGEDSVRPAETDSSSASRVYLTRSRAANQQQGQSAPSSRRPT